MAMLTQIIDGDTDEVRSLPHGWGWWHVDSLTKAVKAEGGEFKQAFSPGWTFTTAHRFVDPADGEVLQIMPGDTFRWWWS